MIIRPYGYSLWERMQADVDRRIKAAGAQNAYFPLFIPHSYLEREAAHVEGFSPELAVVTHGGGKELEEPLVVRPTSETLFGAYMAKWIQSYRDLPVLLNQWANVVRWELRPRLFLRTSEFLWQEGHTAHETQDEAAAYARLIHLDVYTDFVESVLAIPALVGWKTPRERFAGATNTLTCEAMMGDGKALQMATSHELGQNFARAFDIEYLGRDGERHHVWTTSWGSSTRMVGGLIMAHGDDNGLRIPPRLAPIQVVLLPVRDDSDVLEAVDRIAGELDAKGLRSHLDKRSFTFGRRVNDWELKGIPVRVEVGPRDLATGMVTVVRRDAAGGSGGSSLRASTAKEVVPLAGLADRLADLLDDIQDAMYAEALAERDARIHDVASLDEAIEAGRTGFARLPWRVLGEEGELRLASEAITVRCLQQPDGSLPESADQDDLVCIAGRAY
jgi:prolyl-tRNA synthetase